MTTSSNESYVLPRWMRPWEQFWFTAGDPTVLALMRMPAGIIVVYSLFAYGFALQDFMGQHAWVDMEMRMDAVRKQPASIWDLDWNAAGPLPAPVTAFQREYKKQYREKFADYPPPPYPEDGDEKMVRWLDDFRYAFNVDARINGARLPISNEEAKYAENYTSFWKAPPPDYPTTNKQAEEIDKFMKDYDGIHPKRAYVRGMPIWSVWFHVTDPTAMAVVHGLFLLAGIFFTIGFCTRFSSAVLWFGSLCYIHRNPSILFGVDTMQTIVLFYLMFSPCGQVYSVDRLIRQWWVGAKLDVVAWWYRLLHRPLPANIPPAEPVPAVPTPTIAANFVIRLLQIHVCIIYLFAGLSKLQGPAWWRGEAVWYTLGNYEFAPVQFELYLSFLRLAARNQLVYDTFVTGSGLFTLTFEIAYPFCIWRPRLRWVFLGAAILLHGGIGLFMGLKTFSLMMLVLNMAFLRKEEAIWLFNLASNPVAMFRKMQQTIRSAPARSEVVTSS